MIFDDIGLTRIQPNAFASAGNLREVIILLCPNLTTIHANAFSGASNLVRLDVVQNSVEIIHETAFNGLSSLIDFYLSHNQLRQLPANLFRPLISLQELFLSNNLIESIDGNLFANNSGITGLHLDENRIVEIGRDFFNGMPQLQQLNLLGNICADNYWTISGGITVDVVREQLSHCFFNSENELKRFTLVVQGRIIVTDREGNEIIRL